MKLAIRPTQVRNTVNTFVYGLPGCGKTWFLLSSYWERDGRRGGPVCFDTDQGGIDDTALDMGLYGKIPVIPVESNQDEILLYAVAYPDEVIKQVNATPGFEDYVVDTFGFDTISSGIELVLGNAAVSFSDPSKMIHASGVMKQSRKRDHGAPAPGDYKANHSRARLWFRTVRNLPVNTIITCHAAMLEDPGQQGKDLNESKTYSGYPNLPGQLKWDAAKLVDHYFYMEQTESGRFVTHTRKYQKWNARTRIRKFINEPEIDLTFPKLQAIYEKAKKAGEVEAV